MKDVKVKLLLGPVGEAGLLLAVQAISSPPNPPSPHPLAPRGGCLFWKRLRSPQPGLQSLVVCAALSTAVHRAPPTVGLSG